jgi:murein L,D-transpeptidase YafK
MGRSLSLLTLLPLACAAVPDAQAMSFMPDFLRGQAAGPVASMETREYGRLFADRVVVKKSERRLYLMRGEQPFRIYRVSLGTSPKGDKERQGDGRTPEGRYYLDWRNPASKFRKSLHISYPNTSDRLRAKRKGFDPGGMIMIHGQPRASRYRELQELISQEDWTQGCIAVSNLAIDEIWSYTRDGTPIEILP